ncbi:unnamed protein product [Prorocentrum cordatum]|uniref:ShKT domain-containing protein n=1 Tax=Prorocentrum cordatum TaxID=2364126 RepID=A0ABN9R2D9_9DINO|nr:unnamed protein product [Polarella glacialis]CAK0838907.1 unnamed protein product [Polarella glacialis]
MLRYCAQSCQLHGGHCVDKDASCQRVSLGKVCTPDQWGACPKLCKLYREERRRIRKEGKKEKKKLGGDVRVKKEQVKCVRVETLPGLQTTSIDTMFRRIEQGEWAQRYEPKVLSRDPWVMHFGRLLTEKQVDDLRAVAEDGRYPWELSNEAGGVHREGHRTSESLHCNTGECSVDIRVRNAHLVAMNITGLGVLLGTAVGAEVAQHLVLASRPGAGWALVVDTPARGSNSLFSLFSLVWGLGTDFEWAYLLPPPS